MSQLLPRGYLGFHEAASMVQAALFVGEPELEKLLDLRAKLKMNVGDGAARQQGIRKFWSAVDQGKLRLMAVGGRPRRSVRIKPELSREIPLLRRVGSLHYLRSSHRLFNQFTSWFGSNLAEVNFAVREAEVHALVRATLRSRRKKLDGTRRRGRPSAISHSLPVIRKIIDADQWKPTQSVKALTQLVNKKSTGAT